MGMLVNAGVPVKTLGSALRKATFHGQLEAIKALFPRHEWECDFVRRLVDCATERGHSECVEFLQHSGPSTISRGCAESGFTAAAAQSAVPGPRRQRRNAKRKAARRNVANGQEVPSKGTSRRAGLRSQNTTR